MRRLIRERAVALFENSVMVRTIVLDRKQSDFDRN